eukprot:5574593-Lingulodinium_polyedra.AAC.1
MRYFIPCARPLSAYRRSTEASRMGLMSSVGSGRDERLQVVTACNTPWGILPTAILPRIIPMSTAMVSFLA